MKLSRRVVVSGLLLVCAAQVQCTLGPGLSTPDERAKVVALTRSLERDPLIESALLLDSGCENGSSRCPTSGCTRAMICSVTV